MKAAHHIWVTDSSGVNFLEELLQVLNVTLPESHRITVPDQILLCSTAKELSSKRALVSARFRSSSSDMSWISFRAGLIYALGSGATTPPPPPQWYPPPPCPPKGPSPCCCADLTVLLRIGGAAVALPSP